MKDNPRDELAPQLFAQPDEVHGIAGFRCGGSLDFDGDHTTVGRLGDDVHFASSGVEAQVIEPGR